MIVIQKGSNQTSLLKDPRIVIGAPSREEAEKVVQIGRSAVR
jgi:hypothetical protein